MAGLSVPFSAESEVCSLLSRFFSLESHEASSGLGEVTPNFLQGRRGSLPRHPLLGTLHRSGIPGVYPSGQRGQAVNLLAYAFGGSNPPAPIAKPL